LVQNKIYKSPILAKLERGKLLKKISEKDR